MRKVEERKHDFLAKEGERILESKRSGSPGDGVHVPKEGGQFQKLLQKKALRKEQMHLENVLYPEYLRVAAATVNKARLKE